VYICHISQTPYVHYGQIRRYPQNRSRPTRCVGLLRPPPSTMPIALSTEEDRATATLYNEYRKILKLWSIQTERQTDRQTDRYADRNTSHPYRGRSKFFFQLRTAGQRDPPELVVVRWNLEVSKKLLIAYTKRTHNTEVKLKPCLHDASGGITGDTTGWMV